MSDRVEIAGVGIHPFGRFDGVTNTDMGVHAVRAALTEAGSPTFDAAFCGTAYGGVASGHKVLGALALTGVPIVDVEAGCASGGEPRLGHPARLSQERRPGLPCNGPAHVRRRSLPCDVA